MKRNNERDRDIISNFESISPHAYRTLTSHSCHLSLVINTQIHNIPTRRTAVLDRSRHSVREYGIQGSRCLRRNSTYLSELSKKGSTRKTYTVLHVSKVKNEFSECSNLQCTRITRTSAVYKSQLSE